MHQASVRLLAFLLRRLAKSQQLTLRGLAREFDDYSYRTNFLALRDLASSGLISLEVKRGRNGYTRITLLHPAARACAEEARPPAPDKTADRRAGISPDEAEAVLAGMSERSEWLDVVRYRSGVRTFEEAESRVPEFLALMKTRGKTWAKESDLIEHFANWLAKRLKAGRPKSGAAQTSPPAPTATLERAYELITNQKLR